MLQYSDIPPAIDSNSGGAQVQVAAFRPRLGSDGFQAPVVLDNRFSGLSGAPGTYGTGTYGARERAGERPKQTGPVPMTGPGALIGEEWGYEASREASRETSRESGASFGKETCSLSQYPSPVVTAALPASSIILLISLSLNSMLLLAVLICLLAMRDH